MTEAWRIDSLDARAGYAFVSCRRADLVGDETPVDCSSVFLAAPGFAPEALSSRASGFAAARGAAQLGLFFGEQEVGFEGLRDVREFVRRLYLASGGGDEPEGAGPEPERPRAPDGPAGGGEGFEPPGEPAIAVLRLIRAGKTAARMIGELTVTPENVAPVVAFDARVETDMAGPDDAGRSLAAGAAELAYTLISTAPIQISGSARDRWIRAMRCLAAAVESMGLRDTIRKTGPWPRVVPEARRLLPLEHADSEVVQILLLLAANDSLFMLSEEPRSHDPLDDLADWPVSSRAARVAGLDPANATAFRLVSALSACPQRLESPDQEGVHAAAAIFLFSAAHIVGASGEERRRAFNWDSRRDQFLLERAVEWITGQWPQFLFPGPIEAMISAASKRPAPDEVAGARI